MFNEKLTNLLCAVLPSLNRSVIAVKLIKNEEEYINSNANELNNPINYCQMVKAASTTGAVIKSKENMFKCRSGARALGLDKTDIKNKNGENWTKLGLHKNIDISKKIRQEVEYLDEDNFGVLVAPLEKIEIEPDVVIIVGNPYTMMRVVQGYTYAYGRANNVNIMGNQAICVESTSRPYLTKDMNVSFLCVGTRHKAGWNDDEMSAGIPIEQFENVVDGIFNTVNIMETDENKRIIDEKLKELNIDYKVVYSYNYYMDA